MFLWHLLPGYVCFTFELLNYWLPLILPHGDHGKDIWIYLPGELRFILDTVFLLISELQSWAYLWAQTMQGDHIMSYRGW